MSTTPDDARTPFSARGGCWALIASAVAVVVLVVAGVAVVLGSNAISCASPSLEALKAQEAFVLTHVVDARDVESGTADCDDNGDGYVNFTTDLTPAGARDAFLADPSCSPYADEGVDQIAVKCRSGRSTVFVFFTATRDGPTEGALNLS